MTDISFATYNTWNCQGALARRLALMTSGLKALDADVVLLQEVFAQVPSGLDVAQKLGQDLDRHVVFAPARKKLRNLDGEAVLCHSGLALLSREPIQTYETVRLPEDSRDGERLGLLASVTIKGRRILVANVHLSHLKNEDALRQRQLEALIARMESRPPHDGMILGGDLNLATGHGVLQMVQNEFGFASIEYERGMSPATTLNRVGGALCEDGAIDHLFVKCADGVACRARARTALDQPAIQDGVYASDHMAVIGELTFA